MKNAILLILITTIALWSCQNSGVSPDDETLGTENEKSATSSGNETDEPAEFPLNGDYQLKGTIGGSYAFFMVLNGTKETDKIGGEYAYKKGSGSLKLDGVINSLGMIILDEYDQSAESTGHFIGKITGTDSLSGMWYSADGNKQLPFEVVLVNNKEKKLSGLIPRDLYKDAQQKIKQLKEDDISGTYLWSLTYMDEEFSTGQLGIISNQGTLVIESVSKTKIRYRLEAVCGPTYHLAFASGTGIIQGDSIVCTSSEQDGLECSLVFKKKSFVIDVYQKSSSADCGFGARAYVDGTYLKVLPDGKWQKMDDEMFVGNLDEAINEFLK